MRWSCLFLALFVVAFSASGAGMNLPCVGARALAMGGAFRAVADDGSALYWNPAGIAQIDNSQVAALGHYLMTFSTFTPADTLVALNGLFREDDSEKLDRTFLVGHVFSVFVPSEQSKWRWGFGVYSPSGVGSTWDVLHNEPVERVGTVNPSEMNPMFPDSNYILGITEALPDEDFRAQLMSYTFSPGASYALSERISIGIAGIYSFARLDVGLPSADYNRMEADTGVVFQEGNFEGSSYGFNLGALFDAGAGWSFGGNFKLQSDFSLAGDLGETIYQFHNEDLHRLALIFGDTILAGGVLHVQPISAKAKLPRPLEFGIGASFRPNDRWLFALDLSFTQWSELDSVILEPSSGENDRLAAIPMHWKDTYRISAGGEFNFSRYSARLGAFYEPNPPLAAYQNLFIPDMNDRVAFTGGLAGFWEDLIVELSAELEFFGETTAEPNWDGDFLLNIPSTFSSKVASIVLSVIYSF